MPPCGGLSQSLIRLSPNDVTAPLVPWSEWADSAARSFAAKLLWDDLPPKPITEYIKNTEAARDKLLAAWLTSGRLRSGKSTLPTQADHTATTTLIKDFQKRHDSFSRICDSAISLIESKKSESALPFSESDSQSPSAYFSDKDFPVGGFESVGAMCKAVFSSKQRAAARNLKHRSQCSKQFADTLATRKVLSLLLTGKMADHVQLQGMMDDVTRLLKTEAQQGQCRPRL